MLDLYVINLKERTDRLENIKRLFNNYNIIQVEGLSMKKVKLDVF